MSLLPTPFPSHSARLYHTDILEFKLFLSFYHIVSTAGFMCRPVYKLEILKFRYVYTSWVGCCSQGGKKYSANPSVHQTFISLLLSVLRDSGVIKSCSGPRSWSGIRTPPHESDVAQGWLQLSLSCFLCKVGSYNWCSLRIKRGIWAGGLGSPSI